MKLSGMFKSLVPHIVRPRKAISISAATTVQFDLFEFEESESEHDDDLPPNDKSGFECKEDEDVAMFLSLVDKMALKSLLFILQNHARAMNNVCEAQLQCELNRRSNMARNNKNSPVPRFIIKKCRFAEINGGRQVRTVVHEIPSVPQREKTDVWWTSEELEDTLRKARKCLRLFLKLCPKYEESLRVLAGSYGSVEDEMVLDHHIKLVSKQDVPRGFEVLICSVFHSSREQSIQAVLQEQEKQRYQKHIKNRLKQPKVQKLFDERSDCTLGEHTQSTFASSSNSEDFDLVLGGNSAPRASLEYDEIYWNRIRECYKGVCTPCRTYALRIAECDQLQALKATISTWK